MNLFKIISQPLRVHNWVTIEGLLGIQSYQWVRRLGTFMYAFIGETRTDKEYFEEFCGLMRRNGCAHKKKSRTTYDYEKFINLHWDKVSSQKYPLLRIALYLFDEGQKSSAIKIYDRLIETEEDEEFKAILIVKRQYFLDSDASERYIKEISEKAEYQFIRKYKRAWGMVLLHLAEISFNKGDYTKAEEYLKEILGNNEYKSIPLIYLYAKQMQGDIYYYKSQFTEADNLYGETVDDFVSILVDQYFPGYKTEKDPLKLIIDKLVKEYANPRTGIQMHSAERRWNIVKSLSIGRLVGDSNDIEGCYKSNEVGLSLRFYISIMASVMYRSQSIRLMQTDNPGQIVAVFRQVQEFINHFSDSEGSKIFFPFKENEQIEHLFLMAENYLRLNDILQAKSLYESILSHLPTHLPSMIRMAELRFLKPAKKDARAQAQSLREDIAYYKKCLSNARSNRSFSIIFNYFIFKASSMILELNPKVSVGNKLLGQSYSDYMESIKNLAGLMKGTAFEFYWQYLLLQKGDDKNIRKNSITDIKKVISSFKEFTKVNNTEKYLLREIFGTDNQVIVNARLREIRDNLNLCVDEKQREEDQRKQREETERRQRKIFESLEEAATAFFTGAVMPDNGGVFSELGIHLEKQSDFLKAIEAIITKNKGAIELILLSFQEGSMQFAEVSVEIPFGILRNRGFAKVKFRKYENGKISLVLFKENGDFVQAEIPENNFLNGFSEASLFNKLFYLVLLNLFAISQDQIQKSPFGDAKIISEEEELKPYQTPLTTSRFKLKDIFFYANPLIQLMVQRLLESGICDSDYLKRLKEQIDIQRHLLVFKKSAYKPRIDQDGHLIINLDDFKDSPIRRFFEAIRAEIRDGKIYFTFILSGNMEINGQFNEEGIMSINLPNSSDSLKNPQRIEYSIIMELENFILHLLNTALFEDIRQISERQLRQDDKEKRYAKISKLIGYPDEMKEAFGVIYTRHPLEKRRWRFENIGSLANPFLSSDLFVLTGESQEGIKTFKPVLLDTILTDDDILFQPRFVYASKSLHRGKPVDSASIYSYILNTLFTIDRYRYGFRKKWSEATPEEREEVLNYIKALKEGRVHDSLLEVDPTHSLGVSFGWRDLQVRREDGIGEVERAKVYYAYVPPYIRFMELQGKERQAVIDQMKAKKPAKT